MGEPPVNFAILRGRRLAPGALPLRYDLALEPRRSRLFVVIVGGATGSQTRLIRNGSLYQNHSAARPAEWLARSNYKDSAICGAFPDMDLRGFKFIFFEWGHRLLGRLIGRTLLPLIFSGQRAFASRIQPSFSAWRSAPCRVCWLVDGQVGAFGPRRSPRAARDSLVAGLVKLCRAGLARRFTSARAPIPERRLQGRSGLRWHGLARPFANRARRLRRWLARGARVQYMAADRRIFWRPR